jgi:predicted alpha/beta hydrolase family esterase
MVATLIRWVIVAEWASAAALGAWLASSWGWPVWLAIAAALALPALMHGSVIGLQSFSGARQRRRDFADSPPPVPDSAAVAVRAWLGETRASLRSFMLLMPWYGARPLPSGSDPDRLPVVLVHGYFCNRAIWRPMASRLAARGHATASPNLEPPLADIEDYVDSLEETVEALRARTGADRVALIGHSMGGLVIRAWLRRHGPQRAAAIVTLGTPHRGTWSARHAIGRNVAQMREGSAWLADLANCEPVAVRQLFTVIVTLHDNIVMPQAAQSLDDARTIVLSGIGHVALAQQPRVFTHVTEALDRAGESGNEASWKFEQSVHEALASPAVEHRAGSDTSAIRLLAADRKRALVAARPRHVPLAPP